MSFANQTAIVTGAGKGIGFEIGRQLAREGAQVFHFTGASMPLSLV